MEDFFEKQPKVRKESILKLKSFMENPGRFPVLLLGERGVGKSFWIEKINTNNKPILFINSFLINETEDYWTDLLEKSNEGYLVIKEVERLSKTNQELLFNAISTQDGNYGLKDKKYSVRLILTSVFDISVFTKSEEYLNHKFFDRISQFVVKIPSFKDYSINIEQDFVETWKKFKFKDHNKIPEGSIIDWLNKCRQKVTRQFQRFR